MPRRVCRLRRRFPFIRRALAGQKPTAARTRSAILGRGVGGSGRGGDAVSCGSQPAGVDRHRGSASGAESAGESGSEGGAGRSPGRGTDSGPVFCSYRGSGTGSRLGPGRGSGCATGAGSSADSGSNAGSDSGHHGEDRRSGAEEAGPEARGTAA